MSVYYNNAKIVTDGLILYLDAANRKSYSGSGVIWSDLSGNANHAYLNGNVNNPTWNSAGYWNFPASATGLNGGMYISSSITLNAMQNCTIEMTFTLETKTLGDGGGWMCLFSKSTGTQQPGISINQGLNNGNRYLHVERPSAFNSAADLFTDYTGNRWYHITVVLGSTSFGYLNGAQVSTSAGGISTSTSPIYLGLDLDDEMFKGKLAIVRIYNRNLNVEEIQQNFNALRGRFGI